MKKLLLIFLFVGSALADNTFDRPKSGTTSIDNWPSTYNVGGTVSVGNTPHVTCDNCSGGTGGGSAVSTVTFNGAAQPVTVGNFPAIQSVTGSTVNANINGTVPVSGTFWPATQPVSGTIGVTGSTVNVVVDGTVPVSGTFWQGTQPVSGTFWQGTQPISGAVSVSNLPATTTVTFNGAAQPVSQSGTWNVNNTQVGISTVNVNGTVPVSGTFWQGTQPVSGSVSVGNFPATQAVSGTFWQATQPVSGSVSVSNFPATQNVTGSASVSISTVPSTSLATSSTSVTGGAVVSSCPAVAGQFHYITHIDINKIFTAANSASATPLVCTTSNLPGGLAFSFGQPTGAIGIQLQESYEPAFPLKSSAAGSGTLISCPATVGIIWRISVLYWTGP